MGGQEGFPPPFRRGKIVPQKKKYVLSGFEANSGIF